MKKIHQKIFLLLSGITSSTIILATACSNQTDNKPKQVIINPKLINLSTLQTTSKSAKIKAIIDASKPEYNNATDFKIIFNNISYIAAEIKTSNNQKEIIFNLNDLNPATIYTFIKLEFKNSVLNSDVNNFSFTTTQQSDLTPPKKNEPDPESEKSQPIDKQESYKIESVQTSNVHTTSAILKIKIHTSSDILNASNFILTLNNQNYTSSSFNKQTKEVTFELDNLNINTTYKLNKLLINDKEFPSFDFSFKTKAENVVESLQASSISHNSLSITFSLTDNNLDVTQLNVEVSDYSQPILVSFNQETQSYNFTLTNLTPQKSYTINSISYQGKTLSIKSLNHTFTTTSNALQVNQAHLVSKSKNTAAIEFNLNRDITDNELASLSVDLTNNEATTKHNKFKYLSNHKILLQIDSLKPQTTYKLTKLTLNNNDIALNQENQLSFTTSKEVTTDSFAISKITYKDITATSATMHIDFSSNDLLNENHHEFEVNLDNKVYKFSDYNPSESYVEIVLDNLDFHTKYFVNSVTLNDKTLTLPTDESQKSFTTLDWNRPVILNSLGYTFEDKVSADSSDVMSLDFGVIDLFPLHRSQYFFTAEFTDENANKDYNLDFFATPKENNNNQLSLDNIRIFVKNNPEEADEGHYYDLEPNKTYKLKALKLTNGDGQSEHGTLTFTLKQGASFIIDTHINTTRYQNVEITNTNNNLNVSLSLSADSSDPVSVDIKSDFGGLWNINLTKTNDKYTGSLQINNFPSGTYSIARVYLNSKPIFVNKNNKGNDTLRIDASKPTTNNINTINYSYDKFNYQHNIILDLQSNNTVNTFVYKQSPNIVIQKNDSEDFINLNSIWNPNTNKLEIKTLNLDFATTYKVIGIGSVHINENKSFTTIAKPTTKAQLSVDELNSLINSINHLTLKKRWWASGIKKVLLADKDLFKYFNFSNKNGFDNEITFNFDESKFSNLNELNGTLSLTLKLSSGNNHSIEKTFKIENLYSKAWIIANKTNTLLFDPLVHISKTGMKKSTKDFDDAYKDAKYSNIDDLDSSFGKPAIIVDLNDASLQNFIDIDDGLKSYDPSVFKAYFVKYKDDENVYKPYKTTAYAPLGMIQYKIMFWFNPTNAEDKYTNQITPLWLVGFNNYTNKDAKDWYTYLSRQAKLYASADYLTVNSSYGLKSTATESAEQMVASINNKANSQEKVDYLDKYTNLIKFINDNYNVIKDAYNPAVARSYYQIEIINASKIEYGKNKFVDITFALKPIYLGASDAYKAKTDVIAKNVIHIQLLNNN
ncbi:hypothetical protein [Mycoplasma sp. 4423]